MIRLITFFTATLLPFLVLAQRGPLDYTSSDKKAIKMYEEGLAAYNLFELDQALVFFEEACKKDPAFIEPHIMLAQIYTERRKLDEAIEEMKIAIELNPRFFPNNHYFYGELLLRKGRYEEAEKSFVTFLEFNTGSDETRNRAMLNMESCVFAKNALLNPVPFEPINLGAGVNSPQPEYYPGITADQQRLLYTRLVPNDKDGQEDFFISSFQEGTWQASSPIHEINTPLNEGAPTFSPDGMILIFTACELNGDWGQGRAGLGHCDLFFSQRQGTGWSAPENLGEKVNSFFWESQPSYASDGRTVYFVRGRKGQNGLDEQDIWVSRLGEDRSWGKPERLKGKVNTPYTEESVMIHPDGRTLYFSSDGHPGMGGLDIFVSYLDENGEWAEPINLGYPINTCNDENSLLVSASGEIAFFASDREGGFGDLDLYSFELPQHVRPVPVNYCKGKVYDKSSLKRLEAHFELIDLESGKLIVESYSDPLSGEFLVCLPEGKEYALNVNRPGYLFYSANVIPRNVSKDGFSFDVPLQKIKAGSSIVLNNVFFDTDKSDLKPASKIELNKLVQFLSENPTLRVELGGHTDNIGSDADNLNLSERRAKAVVDFLVANGVTVDRLTAVGYGESKPLESNDTAEGRAKNRRTEFTIL
jgi:outer membrane protein OmpA-like peptidoglycan-associated protein